MTAAEVAQAKTQNKNTPLTLSAAELAGSALIEVSGRFNSLVVANELQINIQQFGNLKHSWLLDFIFVFQKLTIFKCIT